MTTPYIYIILFALHTAISILAGYWFYFQFSIDHKQALVWRWLGFLFSFFMPIYGLFGIFFIYTALKWKTKSKDKASKITFDEHLRKDRITKAADETTLMNINWQEEKQIQPLADALKAMDVELRKGAVDALAAKGDRESVKMLADSLENTVLEVRYFAVEALAKISKNFGDKIIDAQKKAEAEPDSYENIIELANCYYEYATSNVEDKTLSEYYLRQASKEYENAIRMNQNDVQLLTRYGEILTRLDKFFDALKIFKHVAARDAKNVDAMVHMADIYLKMGKIRDVKKISKQIQTTTTSLPEEVQQAASVWI